MKKDIYDFLKAHAIAKSIEEGLREGAIKDMSTIADEEFLKNITSEDYFENSTKELENAYAKRDIKGFSSRIKARERKYRRMRTIRIIALSTSVAAALAVISFNLLKDNDEMIPVTEFAKVESEVVVPVLITPNHVIKLVSENNNTIMTKPSLEEKDSVFMQRLVVPCGFTYTIMLSDSTEVVVNAGSELSYASKFVGEKREVELKGEAYFKVKKDTKPFIVKTEGVFIKVYGTQFNINSYDKEKIQAVLISGSIGLTNRNVNEEIILKPNQMAMVDKQGKINLSEVNVEKYVSWMRGEIVNDNEPLTEFLSNVARWYNVAFVFSGDVEKINISAEIKNDRPLEEVLKSIEIISDVKITKLKDNKYMVRK